MAEILKLTKFLERDGKAQVYIRGGRIDAEFDIQAAPETQLREEFGFADDLGRASFQNLELRFG